VNMCMYMLCLCGPKMYALISIVDISSAGREDALGMGWPYVTKLYQFKPRIGWHGRWDSDDKV